MIPTNWGRIQNNSYDKDLRDAGCNIFCVMSLSELNNYIVPFDENHQCYYKRRWFLTQCLKCDEYLFNKNDNVELNPIVKDKRWDICINGNFRFDVKGTRIPKDFKDDCWAVINDPYPMGDYYYSKQSDGVRKGMQNRLFVIHHSFVNSERENYLRCEWNIKEKVFKKFADSYESIHHFIYEEKYLAAFIFLIEVEDGVVMSKIAGLDDGPVLL